MGKTVINSSIPAAPAGAINVKWQATAETDDPRYASAHVRKAVEAGQMGLIELPNPLDATKVLKGDGSWGAAAGGGGGPTIKVNGVDVPLQSVLNLIAGSGITLTPDGAGGVTIAGSGAGSYTPPGDVPPAVPNAMDDEFAGAALDAKWTWVNQGTSTAQLANGELLLTGQASGAYLVRGIFQDMPAAPCAFAAKISVDHKYGNRAFVGLGVRFGTKNHTFGPTVAGSGGVTLAIRLDNWSDDVTFGNTLLTLSGYFTTLYYKAVRTGTSEVEYWVSLDGVHWSCVYISTGATPSKVGLVVFTDSAAGAGKNPTMTVHWFRRTA